MLPSSTPDLFALQLLDSVAELGSLSQAAARHGVSQAAVSGRMNQLERRLGITLLQRGPTGTRLTPAGRQIAELGRRVLTAAEAMMDGVAAVLAAEGPGLPRP
jgi:DNA-binding transcriptional LysR family regulator